MIKIPLISYGTHYEEWEFDDINNQTPTLNKPIGGYWANEYGSRFYNWRDYVIDNCSAGWRDDHDVKNIYTLFNLVDNARVITIHTRNDLYNVTRNYPLQNLWADKSPKLGINFVHLRTDYDAIHITYNAVWECRYPRGRKYGCLNSWDIDTYCIMNKEAIDKKSVIHCTNVDGEILKKHIFE